MKNNHLKIIFQLIALWMLLFSSGIMAADVKAISFLASVSPNSAQTLFTIQLNDQQISTDELNALLRQDSGGTLRVTSMNGYTLGNIPVDSDYAAVFIGAIKSTGIRGFGAGAIALSGGGSRQINFAPGLVIKLQNKEEVVLQSLSTSNIRAHIEVHGFIEFDR